MVRLPLEQLADTVELPVREAERAVERLFRDLRQTAIVAGKGDSFAASPGKSLATRTNFARRAGSPAQGALL